MEIRYMVTHCHREDYDEERWDVLKVFDKVEDAIQWAESHSISDGYLFIDVSWTKSKA